jgi:hypothetical protein
MPSPLKSLLITLLATSVLFGCYEWYLRQSRYIVSYDDEGGLFADIRRKIYQPADQATILTGSSRIKFGLDLETWQKETGEAAIQLANVGSSGMLILQDLAEDEAFTGKVLIDVTESTHFDLAGRSNRRPQEKIDYYKKETIAQRWSFLLNDLLESGLVFLDKENFSLSAHLKKIPFPKREGKMEFPPYPTDFGRISRGRQESMEINFTSDTAQIGQMKNVWLGITSFSSKMAETPQAQVDSVIMLYKSSIEKIEARNGQVVFVRMPSSGKLRELEKMYFPQEKYWSRLLELTGAKGIHFEEEPSLKDFICVEHSHLSKEDSKAYTMALIQVLKREHFFH